MLIAAPVMKDVIATSGMSSTMRPRRVSPINKRTAPAMTDKARAMSGASSLGCVFCTLMTMLPTMVDMTATVPIVMSLEVAKAQYKMKPTKLVYRPYSAGSFASKA